MRAKLQVMVLFVSLLSGLLSAPAAQADTTGLGKIEFTQGHVVPNCRTVKFRDNATGAVMYFRILDVQGKDDVAAVVMAALVAKRDVQIYYDPGATSGCGSEPKITYITMF